MSVESDLVAELETIAAGKVFPDLAPEGTAVPYIVYQQIGGDAPSFLDRTNPSLRNARIQINVWAATRVAAIALALQVEAKVVTSATVNGKPIAAFVSLYDEETGLRGASQDFSLWGDR